MLKKIAAIFISTLVLSVTAAAAAEPYYTEDTREPVSESVVLNMYTDGGWNEIDGYQDWAATFGFEKLGAEQSGIVCFGDESIKISFNKNAEWGEFPLKVKKSADLSNYMISDTNDVKAALSFWMYVPDDPNVDKDYCSLEFSLTDADYSELQKFTVDKKYYSADCWTHITVPLSGDKYKENKVGGIKIKPSVQNAVTVIYLDNIQIINMSETGAKAKFFNGDGQKLNSGNLSDIKKIDIDFGSTPVSADIFTAKYKEAYPRTGWTATAFANSERAGDALNGNEGNYWYTYDGNYQKNGQDFTVDMQAEKRIAKVMFTTGKWSVNKYPRKFRIEVSDNNSEWRTAGVFDGEQLKVMGTHDVNGTSISAELKTPVMGKYIRIVIAEDSDNDWDISTFFVYDAEDSASASIVDSNGSEISSGCSFDKNANSLILTLDEALDNSKEYFVKLENIKNLCGIGVQPVQIPICFIAVTSVQLNDIKNAATVKVVNNTDADVNGTILFAVYSNDTLVAVANAENQKFEKDKETLATLSMPEEFTWESSYVAKTMLWNSLGEIKPLCAAKYLAK